MPSYRIDASTVSYNVFDVIGKDGEGNPSGFIRHVGLAQTTGKEQPCDPIAVCEMGPPLRVPGQMKADAVGTAELTDDEIRKIKTFIDRYADEHQGFSQLVGASLIRSAPQMYCIYPHRDSFSEDDGRYPRTRFSCSGFVFEAYRKARIQLLDEANLPLVKMDVVQSAYPDMARLMEHGHVDPARLGLEGDGPWPLMLCGYLFHALHRNAAAVRHAPYTPQPGDEVFNPTDSA